MDYKKTTKLTGMTCHHVNKTVMKQNCIETLNQHAQPLEKKAAFSSFTWNFGNPSTKTTEKRDSWTINRVIPPQLAEICNDFPTQSTWLSYELLQAQLPRLRPAPSYGCMNVLTSRRRWRILWVMSHTRTLFIYLFIYYKIVHEVHLSLIHIWRCRRSYACRSRWSPYH